MQCKQNITIEYFNGSYTLGIVHLYLLFSFFLSGGETNPHPQANAIPHVPQELSKMFVVFVFSFAVGIDPNAKFFCVA